MKPSLMLCVCCWFCIIRKPLRQKRKEKIKREKKEKIAKKETNREEKRNGMKGHGVWHGFGGGKAQREAKESFEGMEQYAKHTKMQKCLCAKHPKYPQTSPGGACFHRQCLTALLLSLSPQPAAQSESTLTQVWGKVAGSVPGSAFLGGI